GPAVVYYSAASISPCSGTNPGWLQCATGGGAVTWRIYVRDLDRARYAKWRWWDKTQSCGNAPTTCWYLERAMIHEAGHAVPTFGHDDGLTENDTVMRSYAPVVGAPGGNHFVFQRCDQAALQLLWDVAKFTLPYGDCFDDIPGHGSTGLVTTLTATTGTFSSCVTAARLIRGRLAVQNTTYYGLLADNPIAGRTVWFDRKRSVDAAWTLRAESVIPGEQLTGYNWARAFTAPGGQPGSIDYRAHFDGDKGLDPSAQPTFTINWLYGC
ncbi:MAG TPA: hypothetical protein VIV06_08685, partial [Candidatus Limnocylindrales bacterium]